MQNQISGISRRYKTHKQIEKDLITNIPTKLNNIAKLVKTTSTLFELIIKQRINKINSPMNPQNSTKWNKKKVRVTVRLTM